MSAVFSAFGKIYKRVCARPSVWSVRGTIANHPPFLLVSQMSGDGGAVVQACVVIM